MVLILLSAQKAYVVHSLFSVYEMVKQRKKKRNKKISIEFTVNSIILYFCVEAASVNLNTLLIDKSESLRLTVTSLLRQIEESYVHVFDISNEIAAIAAYSRLVCDTS